MLVQNRVAIAEPRLPEEVQRLGIVTRKTTPDFLLVINLISPGQLARSRLHLELRADPDQATGWRGSKASATCSCSAAAIYAMRVWIDPGRAAALQPDRRRDRRRAARAERAGRRRYARPAADAPAQRLPAERRDAGPLHRPARSSRNVVIQHRCRGPPGARAATSRASSWGREDYSTNAYLTTRRAGDRSASCSEPGSNALAVGRRRSRRDGGARRRVFPPGLEYPIM